MIRLFRWMNFKGQDTRRIFLYAIGEIILVVIGILIAVSINNWNQARKLKEIERVTLKRLAEDLRDDLDRFEFLIESYQKKGMTCDSVIQDIRKQSKFEDRHRLVKYIFNEYFLVESYTITYDEMLNTGRLYSLSNDSIRAEIISYYRQVEKWSKYIEKSNTQLRQFTLQPGLNDYWILQQSKGLSAYELTAKFPWLRQAESRQLKDIESLAIRSRESAFYNLGTIRYLRRICGELLKNLENLSNED